MYKNSLQILLITLLASLNSACTEFLGNYFPHASQHAKIRLIPFTQQLRERYQLSLDDLLQLNYYLAKSITLRSEASSGEHHIDEGRLVRSREQFVNEIIIKAGTPGIAVNGGDYWLDISFERGNHLQFGSAPDNRAIWQGKYSLFAVAWHKNGGDMVFNNIPYTAVNESADTYLLIDSEVLYQLRSKKRTLKGRYLDSANHY